MPLSLTLNLMAASVVLTVFITSTASLHRHSPVARRLAATARRRGGGGAPARSAVSNVN